MATYTTNYNLKKPAPEDFYNVQDQNDNMDIVDSGLVPYGGSTSGSANAYTIATPAISTLSTGMAVSVQIHADSSAASTLNWNSTGAKGIKKANGTDVTNLKAGGIYTMRYDGTNFILQGEGASGDATASDLLSGKTATTDAGEITGTIPSKATQTYTPSTANQTIASGQYLSGTQTILGDADLVSANIKAGVNIFGVAGKASVVDVSDSTWNDTAQILSGYTAYANSGIKWTGTMPNRGTVNITPSASNQSIAQGYHSGSGVVYGDADLTAANIKSGVNIFNVVGSYNGPLPIKSIQQGATSSNSTITITAVDITKSIVIVTRRGTSDDSSDPSGHNFIGSAYLSGSTTLVVSGGGYSPTATVHWQVVEFEPTLVKSVQRGSRTGAGPVTITSVNTAKSIALYGGNAYAYSSFSPSALNVNGDAYLSSSTNVQIYGTTASGHSYRWEVIEFN